MPSVRQFSLKVTLKEKTVPSNERIIYSECKQSQTVLLDLVGDGVLFDWQKREAT